MGDCMRNPAFETAAVKEIYCKRAEARVLLRFMKLCLDSFIQFGLLGVLGVT